ncbi:GIY-YIG nuclease family protein [Salinibacter sp.]|uniref:GIY-YIG nuclease family protein n=1 Tax=Salinibacter sp. TaxID=2065818 RepID=UPI0021E7DA3E|nr:GIY-YIG nuclease family protein [Salinibacter sp.]
MLVLPVSPVMLFSESYTIGLFAIALGTYILHFAFTNYESNESTNKNNQESKSSTQKEWAGSPSVKTEYEKGKDKNKWRCKECGYNKYKDKEITQTVCPRCDAQMHLSSGKIGNKSGVNDTKEKVDYTSSNKNMPESPTKQKPQSKSGDSDNSSGYVYVLVSSEKPNLVKIGSTERDPQTRAKELSSNTGVAMPYIVAYQAEVDNPEQVEKAVHNRLSERRVNPNREFFRVETRRAIKAIERETLL